MSNIIFIFGEDWFRSFEYLKALKDKYIDKALGDTNLSVLEGAGVKDIGKLQQVFTALPFLTSKRLVVVRNLIQANKKLASQSVDLLDGIPSSTILVFYEGGAPDQRNRLVQRLKRQAVIKQFNQLRPFELKDWVKKKLAQSNKRIEPAALDLLLKFKVQETGAIYQEIEKLVLVNESQITREKVKQLVSPLFSDRIYQLTDLFLADCSQSSLLKQADKLRLSGENEIYIFFSLVNFCRYLLLVSCQPSRDIHYLMKQFGMNFFLARRLSQVRLPEFSRLKVFYQRLFDYDLKIKTGKIKVSLALDLIVCQWAKIIKGGSSA